MPEALNKQQLIVMVQEILDAIKRGKDDDQQWEKWLDLFDQSTPLLFVEILFRNRPIIFRRTSLL